MPIISFRKNDWFVKKRGVKRRQTQNRRRKSFRSLLKTVIILSLIVSIPCILPGAIHVQAENYSKRTQYGNGALALGGETTAMGHNALAFGDKSVAIGTRSNAGRSSNYKSGYKTVAVGYRAVISGEKSIAIGANTRIVEGKNSVAIGYRSDVNEDNVVSFGCDAGQNAALEDPGEDGEITRRLIHVSKGHITETSTDAVNGSQLYDTEIRFNEALSRLEQKDMRHLYRHLGISKEDEPGSLYEDTEYLTEAESVTDAAKTLDSVLSGHDEILVRQDERIGQAESQIGNLYGEMDYMNDSLDSLGKSINAMGKEMHHMNRRINKVGAGAAALASLKPLSYDPDYKWEFAAGVGSYRDANAAALGLFYHPNEDTMINLSATLGSEEKMVSGGFSVRIGRAHGPASDGKQNKDLLALVEKQGRKIEELEQRLSEVEMDKPAPRIINSRDAE